MGIFDGVRDGSAGVRVVVPAGLRVVDDGEAAARAVDDQAGVLWAVVRAPWRLDARRGQEVALRRDVERQARDLFERTFAALSAEEQRPLPWSDGRPRTADRGWSPVVELERLELLGGPAVRLIHRIEYRPGAELVVGRLLVPCAGGTVEVQHAAADSTTGGRESALMSIRLAKEPPGPGGEPRRLSQAEMDDPRHDASFPGHCLSRVRAAQRAALAADVEVLAPDPAPPTDGPVIAPEAGCAVVAPPRYGRLAPGTLPLSPTMTMFTRVGLTVTEMPRMFSVWRHPERVDPAGGGSWLGRLLGRSPGDPDRRLLDVARRSNESWSREGARDVRVEALVAPPAGDRLRVTCRVRFVVGEEPTVSAQTWTLDPDGVVFRLASDATPCVPFEELEAENHAALATLARRD